MIEFTFGVLGVIIFIREGRCNAFRLVKKKELFVLVGGRGRIPVVTLFEPCSSMNQMSQNWQIHPRSTNTGKQTQKSRFFGPIEATIEIHEYLLISQHQLVVVYSFSHQNSRNLDLVSAQNCYSCIIFTPHLEGHEVKATIIYDITLE